MRALAAAALLVVGGGCARTSFFGPDEALRVCSTLAACAPNELRVLRLSVEACAFAPLEGLPTPGAVMPNPGLSPIFSRIYGCLYEARGDCAKADLCWSQPELQGACPLRNGSLFQFTCNGDVLTGCTAHSRRAEWDCRRFGMTCSTGGGRLLVGAACTAGCSKESCDDLGVAHHCVGDVPVTEDCARRGLSCDVVEGQARCVEPGSGLCRQACAGGVLQVACSGGSSRFDCAQLAGTTGCDAGQCVPSGDCVGAGCDGDAVAMCRDGKPLRFDCVAEGFGPCTLGGTCTAR